MFFHSAFSSTIFSSFRTFKTLSRSTFFPRASISDLVKRYFSLSLLSFLTKRWAIITFTVETIRKGSTSISISLGIAPAAELVCRVERTKCPVRAALTAILAVSPSRISPTMIISGSCLTKERNPAAKVSPILERT